MRPPARPLASQTWSLPLDVLDESVEVLRPGDASGAPFVETSEAEVKREQAPSGACDPGGDEARPRPYFPKRLLTSLHLMFSTKVSRYFARAMP